jgi:hypothetical protein
VTQKEKIDFIINALESETYSIYADSSEIDNSRNVVEALKKDPLDLKDKRLYDRCPTMLPNFKCDGRCEKDYTLQLECWKEALQDDDDEKIIERKAKKNLEIFQKFNKALEESAQEAGIPIESAIKFISLMSKKTENK